MAAITGMALVDPTSGPNGLTLMAFAAVALGFASATQDIVIDAFRIELATERLQAALSATYMAGYRLAMIMAGAGALAFAESKNFPNLKKLDLRGNFLAGKTKDVLRESLAHLKSLRIFQSE